jgi:hypothetical protein
MHQAHPTCMPTPTDMSAAENKRLRPHPRRLGRRIRPSRSRGRARGRSRPASPRVRHGHRTSDPTPRLRRDHSPLQPQPRQPRRHTRRRNDARFRCRARTIEQLQTTSPPQLQGQRFLGHLLRNLGKRKTRLQPLTHDPPTTALRPTARIIRRPQPRKRHEHGLPQFQRNISHQQPNLRRPESSSLELRRRHARVHHRHDSRLRARAHIVHSTTHRRGDNPEDQQQAEAR